MKLKKTLSRIFDSADIKNPKLYDTNYFSSLFPKTLVGARSGERL